MEEGVPPAGDTNDDPPSKTPPAFRSGTYVVQVPKDQIYRVPPPEHALIAERRRNPAHQKSSCCSCLLWLFLFIILLAIILGIVIGIFYIALKPKSPLFYVERVLVRTPYSDNHPHPEYDITLKAKNPNELMGIYYQRGSSASLSFRQLQIATGKSPAFYQGNKNSSIFQVTLAGSNVVLPNEIQRSMKSGNPKVPVSLSLSMNIPVRMEIGVLKSWSMNIAISCNLSLNTLAKGTQVLSKGCHSNVQFYRR